MKISSELIVKLPDGRVVVKAFPIKIDNKTSLYDRDYYAEDTNALATPDKLSFIPDHAVLLELEQKYERGFRDHFEPEYQLKHDLQGKVVIVEEEKDDIKQFLSDLEIDDCDTWSMKEIKRYKISEVIAKWQAAQSLKATNQHSFTEEQMREAMNHTWKWIFCKDREDDLPHTLNEEIKNYLHSLKAEGKKGKGETVLSSQCPYCGKDLFKTDSGQIYCVCGYEK